MKLSNYFLIAGLAVSMVACGGKTSNAEEVDSLEYGTEVQEDIESTGDIDEMSGAEVPEDFSEIDEAEAEILEASQQAADEILEASQQAAKEAVSGATKAAAKEVQKASKQAADEMKKAQQQAAEEMQKAQKQAAEEMRKAMQGR